MAVYDTLQNEMRTVRILEACQDIGTKTKNIHIDHKGEDGNMLEAYNELVYVHNVFGDIFCSAGWLTDPCTKV